MVDLVPRLREHVQGSVGSHVESTAACLHSDDLVGGSLRTATGVIVLRNAEPTLRLENVGKTFPGNRALDDVSLSVFGHEVLGLVGQNGSGKSTLIKILAGLLEMEPGGKILIHGRRADQASDRARDPGLHFIHQEPALIGRLSTVENLWLGRRLGARILAPVDRRRETADARELLEEFGLALDVHRPVMELTAGEQAVIAIVRALDGWTRSDNILVLDEPTAALHEAEVGTLFTAIRRVVAGGASVILVSHRLREIEEIADRVAVLRDGRLVADVRRGEYSERDLVALMTDGQVARTDAERRSHGGRVLEVREVQGPGVERVTFGVSAGEIVGITGLLGSGVEHIGGLIFGSVQKTAGSVVVAGVEVRGGAPSASIAHGVAFVPAGRGAVMTMTARENLTLPQMSSVVNVIGGLDSKKELAETNRWFEAVDVRPRAPDKKFGEFSGGNQQKIVIAKWLRSTPKVFVLEEPTHGVDVAAKGAIHELIFRAARAGSAIVVASSDTEELLRICDRVLVLREGRMAATIDRSGLSEEALVRASLGIDDPPAVPGGLLTDG